MTVALLLGPECIPARRLSATAADRQFAQSTTSPQGRLTARGRPRRARQVTDSLVARGGDRDDRLELGDERPWSSDCRLAKATEYLVQELPGIPKLGRQPGDMVPCSLPVRAHREEGAVDSGQPDDAALDAPLPIHRAIGQRVDVNRPLQRRRQEPGTRRGHFLSPPDGVIRSDRQAEA